MTISIFNILGYYAEHISPYSEARSNLTVRVKPDSKGIHLHNLSYAGPIVMGCGGKIRFQFHRNLNHRILTVIDQLKKVSK